MADNEGVLRRWHRRKTAAREEATPESELMPELVSEDAAQEAALAVPDDTANAAEDSAAGAPDEDAVPPDLPDIDTLDAESDFSAFLGDGVPEEIQRLALRKLWRLDPVFANLDGLVDYGEDFTDANMVIEGMKTVYRVGKGLRTDEEIAEADAESGYGADTEAEAESVEASSETESVEASSETESDEADGDAPEIAEDPDAVLTDVGDTERGPPEAERSPPEAERDPNDPALVDTALPGAMDDIAKKT